MHPFIHCITCDAVFRKTPYDQVPEQEVVTEGDLGMIRSVERDDYHIFLHSHRGHQLEELKILEGSYVAAEDYREPVKTSYWKATNGKERFVIKGSREDIRDPLKYELIRGDYRLTCVSLEIQSREIARQLEIEFKDKPLNREDVINFLNILKEIAQGLKAEFLQRIPEESSNPLEIYYRMDDVHFTRILRKCRKAFRREDFERLQEFVQRHREDGVLLLKGTHRIEMMRGATEKKPSDVAVFTQKRRSATKP